MKFYYRGGAEITNENIQSYAEHQILNRRNKYPVLLFWFGTCSFTEKINGLFVLKDNIEQIVDELINTYIETKQKLLKLNRRAKIIFLECPYYSLSMYNSYRKKHFKKDFFQQQQSKLIKAIDSHNERIKIINNPKNIPNFNQDFSTRSRRKNRNPRTVVDYSQLRDGCHIGRKLAELWLLRIHRLIYRI